MGIRIISMQFYSWEFIICGREIAILNAARLDEPDELCEMCGA